MSVGHQASQAQIGETSQAFSGQSLNVTRQSRNSAVDSWTGSCDANSMLPDDSAAVMITSGCPSHHFLPLRFHLYLNHNTFALVFSSVSQKTLHKLRDAVPVGLWLHCSGGLWSFSQLAARLLKLMASLQTGSKSCQGQDAVACTSIRAGTV